MVSHGVHRSLEDALDAQICFQVWYVQLSRRFKPNFGETYSWSLAGSISQCGIPSIEQFAKVQLILMRTDGPPTQNIPYEEFLKDHEVIEIWMRIAVRKEVEKAARDRSNIWSSSVINIWFDLTFPTPPVCIA